MKNIYINKFLLIIFLLFLFSISLFIRSSNFNQPLGRHHEWVLAHTLNTLKIWDNGGGPHEFHLAPIYTFKEKTNRNIVNFRGVLDSSGQGYYVSYPPFAFLFPYYLFKIAGAEYNVANFQLFNFILHFSIALCLFGFLNYLFKKRYDEWYIPSLLGFILYVFTNGLLWFHGNTYFVDMLMQLFIVAQIYFFTKALRDFENLKPSFFILYGIITFLACYTEWLAFFIAFVSGMILLWRSIYFRNKKLLILFFTVGISSAVSGIITIFQYSSIDGYESFLESAIDTYTIRSGNGDPSQKHLEPIWGDQRSFNLIQSHLNSSFHLVTNFTGIALCISVLIGFITRKFPFNKEESLIIIGLLVPIIMHYFFFFNFNALHDFSTLKTALFLIVLIAILSNKIVELLKLYLKNKFLKFGIFIIVSLWLGVRIKLNVDDYHHMNSSKTINTDNLELGELIKKYVTPNHVVFSNCNVIPEVMYYCERNSIFTNKAKDGSAWLKENNLNFGMFFYKVDSANFLIYEINDLGDSTLITELQ